MFARRGNVARLICMFVDYGTETPGGKVTAPTTVPPARPIKCRNKRIGGPQKWKSGGESRSVTA